MNKGIRLDYFLCSRSFVGGSSSSGSGSNGEDACDTICPVIEPRVLMAKSVPTRSSSHNSNSAGGASGSNSTITPVLFDSYMLSKDTVGYSDHCPAVLVLEL